jgi:acetyl-CoA acetyltransferase
MVHSPLTKLQCCPTSDGGAAAVLASEDFVRERGLEARAVEILGIEMATDLPSSFEDKSCIKVVFIHSLYSMVVILRLRYSVPVVRVKIITLADIARVIS